MFNDNKNDYHHQKEHKKLHKTLRNSFFYSLNSFPLSTKLQTSCFPDGYDENGFLATFLPMY